MRKFSSNGSHIPKAAAALRLACLAATVVLAGCSSVQPWQKAYLARPDMQFDPDPLQARLERSVYFSKEGVTGGYGVGGGGCGCN